MDRSGQLNSNEASEPDPSSSSSDLLAQIRNARWRRDQAKTMAELADIEFNDLIRAAVESKQDPVTAIAGAADGDSPAVAALMRAVCAGQRRRRFR